MNENLKKVFANIDSKIFESTEVQENLSKVFEDAVNESAEKEAQKLFEAKEADYTKVLDEMIDTVKQSIELDQKEKFNEAVETKVKEISEEYGKLVKAEAETKLSEEVTRIEEQTQKTIKIAIDEFVQDSKPEWTKELDVAKAHKIVEEFNLLSEAFGIKISKVDESEELAKLSESLDKAVERQEQLVQENNKLVSDRLVQEAIKGLTAPQVDKVNSLMESVKFESESQFKNKIEQYVAVVAESKKSETVIKENSEKKASWK